MASDTATIDRAKNTVIHLAGGSVRWGGVGGGAATLPPDDDENTKSGTATVAMAGPARAVLDRHCGS